MTFRELMLEARKRGREDWEKPRGIAWAAKQCGLSRAQYWRVSSGRHRIPEWRSCLIAKNIQVPLSVVVAALEDSWAQRRGSAV